jgi:hypothetical protein
VLHFYTRAMAAKAIKAPAEVVDKNLQKAVEIAEKVAPYRHSTLTAIKLAGDPNNPARIKDDATLDELRAEVVKHLTRLVSAGVIDLKALPLSDGGKANQPVPSVDQSGINGE